MDHTIVSKICNTREEVETFVTTLRNNGWNLMTAFIQIVPTLKCFIVFYEKYLDEPMKRGQNL